jgi:hypothetical protein
MRIMQQQKTVLLLLLIYQLQWNIALLLIAADAAADQKLFFVFGDSYADTGNLPKSGLYVGSSWLYPYGMTWPHYPDGRFCDGKMQTDFYGKKDYNPSLNLQPASFLPSFLPSLWNFRVRILILIQCSEDGRIEIQIYNSFRRADHHHPCIVDATTARIF